MKNKVMHSRTAQNQLLHENVIQNLISDLDTNQLTYLLMAIDGSHFEKIEREAAIKRLLIYRFRQRLLQNKIVPPFEFVDRINIELASKEILIEKAKEFGHTTKEIALMLLLQNHYEDALMYYIKSLEEQAIEKKDTDNENEYIMLNKQLANENVYLQEKIKELQYEINNSHMESKRTITSLDSVIQQKEDYIQRLEKETTVAQQKVTALESEIRRTKDSATKNDQRNKQEFTIQQKPINQENLHDLFEKVRELFPIETKVIFDNIELLSKAVEDIMKAITEKNSQHFTNRTFDEIANLLYIAEQIHEYEIRIKQLQNLLYQEDNQLDSDEKDNVQVASSVIDEELENSVRTTENIVMFDLTEDMPEWEPIAFSINADHKIKVRNWQDILIESSSLLFAIDASKFNKLDQVNFSYYENENENKEYVSTSPDSLLNPVKIGNLFLEATITAKEIRHIIRKMLLHYHLKSYRFKVYFNERH